MYDSRESNTRNPNPKLTENAMKSITLTAAALAAFVFALPAHAQPAAPAPPSPPAATAASVLYPVKTQKQLSELDEYVFLYYLLVVQNTYVDDRLKPATKSTLGRGARAKAQLVTFGTMFKGIKYVLRAQGEILPSKPDAIMTAHLASHQCTAKEEIKKHPKTKKEMKVLVSSPGCDPLWIKVKAIADTAMAAAPANDFTTNAKKMLDTAGQYRGIVRVILAHGAIARVNSQLTEANRSWKGLDGTGPANSGLVNLDGCIFYKDATPKHCGKVVEADADKIVVKGPDGTKTVTTDETNKGDALFAVGKPSAFVSKVGKKACVEGTKRCAKITVDNDDGVQFSGEGFDSVLPATPTPPPVGHPHDGFSIGGGFTFGRIMPPGELSDAHTIGAELMMRYKFPFPFAITSSIGVFSILGGGTAPHYNVDTDGHTTGLASLGAAFVPQFGDTFGLRIAPRGFLLFNGGGGASVDLNGTATLGPVQLFAGPRFGYTYYGIPMGDNATYPRLKDPVLEGFDVTGIIGLSVALE